MHNSRKPFQPFAFQILQNAPLPTCMPRLIVISHHGLQSLRDDDVASHLPFLFSNSLAVAFYGPILWSKLDIRSLKSTFADFRVSSRRVDALEAGIASRENREYIPFGMVVPKYPLPCSLGHPFNTPNQSTIRRIYEAHCGGYDPKRQKSRNHKRCLN